MGSRGSASASASDGGCSHRQAPASSNSTSGRSRPSDQYLLRGINIYQCIFETAEAQISGRFNVQTGAHNGATTRFESQRHGINMHKYFPRSRAGEVRYPPCSQAALASSAPHDHNVPAEIQSLPLCRCALATRLQNKHGPSFSQLFLAIGLSSLACLGKRISFSIKRLNKGLLRTNMGCDS